MEKPQKEKKARKKPEDAMKVRKIFLFIAQSYNTLTRSSVPKEYRRYELLLRAKDDALLICPQGSQEPIMEVQGSGAVFLTKTSHCPEKRLGAIAVVAGRLGDPTTITFQSQECGVKSLSQPYAKDNNRAYYAMVVQIFKAYLDSCERRPAFA